MDDPVSALNSHYQKNVTPNISLKQQFQYFSTKTINGVILWRCVFTCPLTKETFETTNNSEHSKKEGIYVEGNYYLPSKKKAQKNAALCALHKIMEAKSNVEEDEWNQTNVDSSAIEEKNNHTIECHEKSNLIDLNSSQISPSLPLSHSNWIQDLCSYGLSSEFINASFEEDEKYRWKLLEHNKNEEQISFLCDHQNPTMILCTLQIEHPIRITVTGKPKSSKKEAAKSAVAIIEKEMIQQNFQKNPLTVKNDDNGDEMKSGKYRRLQIKKLKEALLPKTCSLYYPLPPYLTKEIKLDQALILYEIVFEGNQYPWVYMKNNVKNQNSHISGSKTRMGILFPSQNVEPNTKKILKDAHVIQSTFPLPFPFTSSTDNADMNESENTEILIKLIHRTQVSKNSITQEQLQQIQQFNQILLTESKHYGFHNGTNSRQTRKKMFNERLYYDGIVSRSYLFVPLTSQTSHRIDSFLPTNTIKSQPQNHHMMIDWKLVSDVVFEKITPLISSLDFVLSSRYIPYLGYLHCLFIFFTFFLLAILLLIPYFHHLILLQNTTNRFEYTVNSIRTHSMGQKMEEYFGFVCMFLSFLFYLLHHLQRPKWNLSKEILYNRFMIQVNAASIHAILYIYNPPDDKSHRNKDCTSPFLPSDANLTQLKQEYNIRKFNLDLRTATFGDYYSKKYGYIARFPNTKLLPVKSLTKHSTFDPTKPKSVEEQQQPQPTNSSTQENNGVYILPELVKVLPMPRDILYIFQYANSFMPIVERELELLHIQHFLLNIDTTFQSKGQVLESNEAHSEIKSDARKFYASYNSRPFISLLRDATTIKPYIMYDTLEFVGDAVLSYFFAINLFSRNAQLNNDVDDLEEIKNKACRNKCLANRGLYCGIHRMIYGGLLKWCHVVNSSSLQNRDCTKISVNDKHIADVTEALLGVLFLGCDTLDQASFKIISLLEQLNLPLSDEIEGRQMRNTNWFMSNSSCLSGPYNFHLDPLWLQQLHHAEATLKPSNQTMSHSKAVLDFEKLEIGISNLFKILNIIDQSDQEKSKTLLLVALFDDSLENENITSEQNCVTYEHKMNEDLEETSGLIKVALFRDSLFVIGNAVLHLVLSAELFTRYPTATAGDLHLLRVCGGDCDDLLVYIMIKNEIHLSLYDSSNDILRKLIPEIEIADLIGIKRWNKNGGWLLENGIEEFQKRKAKASRWLQIPNDYKSKLIETYPKYVGLNGGRLAGKRDKLSSNLTDELSFSMKAIIGALVVSFGVEKMWAHILPFFEELLLLTPEELRREFGSDSSVCSTYKRGKHSYI